jgi:gamma-glutamyltranspeptidase / glutathione hydrolase
MGARFASKSVRNVARGLRRGLSALAGIGLALGPAAPGLAASLDGGSRTLGVVVADEPHAALAARDILEQGGSVADAATALYFTLTVTYPVAAGLGGGGVCLHYDPKTRTGESIDFLPRATRDGGAVAVPGAVRGFAYLQSRFGRLPWRQLFLPAQRLAALGFPVSHALADALKSHESVVKSSPFLSENFADENGALAVEGDHVTEVSLAATLALIAGKGPIGFYGAPFGTQIMQAASRQGGSLTRADLYDYRAQEAKAPAIDMKIGLVIAPAAQTGAGALAGKLLPALMPLTGSRNAQQIGNAARQAVDEALRSFNVASLPSDFGSTGFLIADREGEIVACGVTMTKPFGTAREVDKTGFALAPAPQSAAGLAGAFLMPLVVTGAKGKDVIFAGVGTGGPDGVSGVTALALAAFTHDPKLLEPAWSQAERAPGNSVNMLACSKGLLSQMRSCTASADPKGYGVALQGREQRSGGGGFLGLF